VNAGIGRQSAAGVSGAGTRNHLRPHLRCQCDIDTSDTSMSEWVNSGKRPTRYGHHSQPEQGADRATSRLTAGAWAVAPLACSMLIPVFNALAASARLRDIRGVGRSDEQREIDAELRDTRASARAAALDDRQQRLDEREDYRDARHDERDDRADQRDRQADQRDRQADQRDRQADQRNKQANDRDKQADQRDVEADQREIDAQTG
jgi:hypothetical protein